MLLRAEAYAAELAWNGISKCAQRPAAIVVKAGLNRPPWTRFVEVEVLPARECARTGFGDRLVGHDHVVSGGPNHGLAMV